jgi:hypothetical protein
MLQLLKELIFRPIDFKSKKGTFFKTGLLCHVPSFFVPEGSYYGKTSPLIKETRTILEIFCAEIL